MTEDQRDPREFEDGLSSGSGAEESGGTQPPGSKMLRELLEKASADRPEYAEDLSILHSLIEYGGPHNCASSMWFRFLKDHYPAEYEALKAEHLDEGKSLQEGFRHKRGFAREKLEHLDVKEDLVFCTESEPDYYYEYFLHEADILLWALGRAVEEGALTLDGLREHWQPYRHRWPVLYEASLKEWEKHLWPSLNGDAGTPVTNAFEHEADILGIPDVGYFGGYSVDSGNLREVLAGSYKIVPKEDSSDYDCELSPRQAIELFEETLTSKDASVLGSAREFLLEDVNDDEACRKVYGVSLNTLKEKLKKGEYLDDIIKALRVGDRVHVYNAYDRNGPFLGQTGYIASADSENDAYTLWYVKISEHFGETFDEELILEGYYDDPVFSREELELLGWHPHHYLEEMSRASWWPEVAEERAKALAKQGRSEADCTEGQVSE